MQQLSTSYRGSSALSDIKAWLKPNRRSVQNRALFVYFCLQSRSSRPFCVIRDIPEVSENPLPHKHTIHTPQHTSTQHHAMVRASLLSGSVRAVCDRAVDWICRGHAVWPQFRCRIRGDALRGSCTAGCREFYCCVVGARAWCLRAVCPSTY